MASQNFDVIVIGLGGMGSATVYQLAQRGQRVLGLDRHPPVHDKGSSHGRSRIIRQAYLEHPDYVPLLLRAYELWAQIEHESQQPLMTITGGLMLGTPDSPVIQGSQLSAQTHGLPHEMLDAAEIRRRYPPLNPSADTVALYETQAGFVDPEATIHAHLQRAIALGATLQFEEPVLSWDTSTNGVKVVTENGTYYGDRLVIAPGAWAPEILKFNFPLEVERQVLYWFEPKKGVEAFLSDRFPIFIWDIGSVESLNGFYGFPAQGNGSEGVKLAFFYKGERCTPETIDRQVYDHEIEHMRSCIRDRIPALDGRCLKTVTCMYTLTPDHHFIIGHHPQHEQVIIASPCSGHGYKFASVVGEILADLTIDGKTRHSMTLFDPLRFK
jgi:sarcosine oxidase